MTEERTKYAIGPSGARSMHRDVVVDERREPLEHALDERLAIGEVVEQAALGDAGGLRGGVEGRGSLAVVDEDALERVEHGVAGGGWAAHGSDRIEACVVRHLILYRPDGTVMEAEMTNETTTTATQPETNGRRTAAPASTPAGGGRVARHRRQWVALAVLMLPVLLVSVDNTVLSFALPAISRDLAPTAAQQLWIIDAYPLVLAGLLVAMGSAGDRFGRRRMLLIGSTGFAGVSVVAAFAPTAEALIAARAALGFFGAMLMPSTLSLLRSVFTDREQRRLAIAIWASGFAAGSALGPLVGGVLLEHFALGLGVPARGARARAAARPRAAAHPREPRPGARPHRPREPRALARGDGPDRLRHQVSSRPRASTGSACRRSCSAALGALVRAAQLRSRDADARHAPLPPGLRSAAAVLVNLLSVIALVGFLFFVSQHLQLIAGLARWRPASRCCRASSSMIAAGLAVVPIARRSRPRARARGARGSRPPGTS